jgi:acyl-lipid omega-6 desaturase (Delta-12 desaturase)
MGGATVLLTPALAEEKTMREESLTSSATANPKAWRRVAQEYQHANTWYSVWQVLSSFVPYLLLWYLMVLSLAYSYWLTLGLSLLAAGFLVRIFIILHDCGHGSFFASRRANEIVGSICGVFTLTPFYQWRHDHAMHHATSSDLDRRGYGDVPMLTVAEYLKLSRWGRFQYRLFRQPLLLLLAGPVYSFVVLQRFTLRVSGARERWSVRLTNVALLAIIGVGWLTIGLKAYLLVHVPIVFFAGSAAVWMFYCQHQFEGTYWSHHEEWSYEDAAIKGSSYFKLPLLLQWFTGNIGFHHVHHLSPRIPNYYLERVHFGHPKFQEVTTITIRSSVDAFRLKLWDEERQRLVGLWELPAHDQQPQSVASEERSGA